jgi:hypothetical protein
MTRIICNRCRRELPDGPYSACQVNPCQYLVDMRSVEKVQTPIKRAAPAPELEIKPSTSKRKKGDS